MKVATFNCNSVRQRLPIILDWLAEYEPDVLALQETKVEDAKFPLAEFEDAGWSVAMHGQKSFNGVAFVSRAPLMDVSIGFADPLFPDDARIISGVLDGIRLINTYVPNGTSVGSDKFQYKLRWMERFRQMLDERYRPDQPLLWMGDINIARTPDDVYNSRRFYGGVGHHPEEWSRLDQILDWGLTDLFRLFNQGPGHYTYWDFIIVTAAKNNLGWRIDSIFGTEPMRSRCRSCVIDREPRFREKPSDHTFVVAEFE